MRRPRTSHLDAVGLGWVGLIALAMTLALGTGVAAGQPAPRVTIGIYAPTIEFGTAQARVAYVQALARAIEAETGISTSAQSYASLAALKSDGVDFAIIDAQCYATHLTWRLLATANVGGSASRGWALFAATGPDMRALRGKKLAYIDTGCNDAGFVNNAMFESEVDAGFFGARVGKRDLTAAVAEVAAYRTAHAVIAPVGAARGLTKVFETGTLPNPAFVVTNGKLAAATVDRIAAAVTKVGGGGAIASWSRPARDPYVLLARRMARVTKAPMLAVPELVRVDARDVLAVPSTLQQPALIEVRRHYLRAPRRMN